MPKGVSAKGYKMTENRKQILSLLAEEGGSLKSAEGRATSLMQGLLRTDVSMAALNASLKELERIGFIKREVEGRRTYGISITAHGKKILAVEVPESVVEPEVQPETTDQLAPGDLDAAEAAARQSVSLRPTGPVDAVGPPISESEWDWQEQENQNGHVDSIPDGIDYDILLGVFLKAAVRGMEGPSSGEVAYHLQQIEQKDARILQLEDEVNKFRAEAARAIAERDQLQKNFNLVMSRAEGKGSRGSNPIRNLLRPEELGALDALMRQLPRTRGE